MSKLSIRDNIMYRLRKIRPENRRSDDLSSAELFAEVFANKHRYCTTSRDWFQYRGGIWKLDTEGMSARNDLKIFAECLLTYSANVNLDPQQHEAFVRYCGKWLRKSFRDCVIQDARDFNFFSLNELDAQPELFCCKNGVLSLGKEVKFLNHDPKLMLSKQAGTEYDASAECPRWIQFMNEVTEGDREKQRYLQKVAGIALLGECVIDRFWILFGASSRNGKSTFCDTLSSVFGDYAASVQPETLAIKKTDSRSASGDVARLAGVRFAVASEAPRRMPLDSALLKSMTGRDRITARFLHQSEFEFVPAFCLIMNTNYLPSCSDTTVFASGRIAVVEFPHHFTFQEQDQHLREKLRKEKAGILNWCIEGLKMYYAEGVEEPASVRQASEEFAQESDRVGVFLDEVLTPSEGELIAVSAIYPKYDSWCIESGFQAMSKQSFIDELKRKKVYRTSGTIAGKTVRNVILGYSDFIKVEGSETPFY